MNEKTTPVTSAAASSIEGPENNHAALLQIGVGMLLLIGCTLFAFNLGKDLGKEFGKASVNLINAKTLKDHDALAFEVEGLRMSVKAKGEIIESLEGQLSEEKSKNMRADFCKSSSQDKIAALKENREKLNALLGVAETKKIIGMMFDYYYQGAPFKGIGEFDRDYADYVRHTFSNGNLEKSEKLIAAKMLVFAVHSELQDATIANQ